jgi:hypothetical protein
MLRQYGRGCNPGDATADHGDVVRGLESLGSDRPRMTYSPAVPPWKGRTHGFSLGLRATNMCRMPCCRPVGELGTESKSTTLRHR